MNVSAPSSRTDTICFAASGWFGATINASSSVTTGIDLIDWSVGLKVTTPISTSRPRISEGIRLARLRFTSILMCGWRARNTGINGSRPHHRVFVRAQSQFAAVQVAQLADGGVGVLAQVQHLLRKIEQHPSRGRQRAVLRRTIEQRARPSSASSRRIAWLTAGCVRCRTSAAREKLFSCATAKNTSNWLISKRVPLSCRLSRLSGRLMISQHVIDFIKIITLTFAGSQS